MDYLVIQNFLLRRDRQAKKPKDESWKKEFELD
jgi:hypothetical protein